MELNKQINFRLTEAEYDRALKYKEIRNKHSNKKIGFRTIFMEKIDDDMTTSNIGLEIKRNELQKEYEELKQAKNTIVENMEEISIKLNKLNTELNNSTLYDLSNFKHNENILKAVNSVKDYCIHNSIKDFKQIPAPLYLELESTFKIKETDLLKNIVSTEFVNWLDEIRANTPESNSNKKLKAIGVKIMANFKNSNQPITDLKEYLETNKEFIIKEFIPKGANFNEVKEYLLKNENHKK